MWSHSRTTLKEQYTRSYMHALRALLGLNLYTIVRYFQDDRVIRESQVSTIEGKTGLNYLWDQYAELYKPLIEKSNHTEEVKEIMRNLLKVWKEIED